MCKELGGILTHIEDFLYVIVSFIIVPYFCLHYSCINVISFKSHFFGNHGWWKLRKFQLLLNLTVFWVLFRWAPDFMDSVVESIHRMQLSINLAVYMNQNIIIPLDFTKSSKNDALFIKYGKAFIKFIAFMVSVFGKRPTLWL